jgi:DNA-binding NarL/FixJ family response regulator
LNDDANNAFWRYWASANFAIGDLLKYSESTIRQETIKIFSKLDCHGRDEASQLYKDQQLKVQAAS